MPVPVSETFISVLVHDMKRATDFYVDALGATVAFASPAWSSLHIAGVRIGLALDAGHAPGPTGLHFAVADLARARAEIELAGGRVVQASVEVAPGVMIAEATDSEGNGIVLTQR
jgi:predicted enzyme related to lactoylglutathione lyase